MHMRLRLVGLILLLAASACESFPGARGKVVDAAGVPLRGAQIKLEYSCSLSDSLGRFHVSAAAGPFTWWLIVKVEAPMHRPYRHWFRIDADTLDHLVITMKSDSSAPLPALDSIEASQQCGHLAT